MKRVLVTGGAGFIGSHIVDLLLNEGVTIRVLDNLSTGKMENLPFMATGLEFIQGAVEDKLCVIEACRNVDAVIHLAALVSVPASIEHPDKSAATNLLGFHNVLEALREQGFKGRLLYASSAAVYGVDVGEAPLTEDQAPGNLASPYAQDKYSNEMYAQLYNKLYGISSLGFRFFNVYGPRQDPDSPYSGVISIFMDRAFAKQDIKIFGDGSQTRDFVYVGDLVKALRLALDSEYQGVLNLGTGVTTEIGGLAEQIKHLCIADVAVHNEPERTGDIKYSLADLSLLKSALDFVPTTPIQEGLGYLKDWMNNT
jgi:UDP-glucose 4-epimerase